MILLRSVLKQQGRVGKDSVFQKALRCPLRHQNRSKSNARVLKLITQLMDLKMSGDNDSQKHRLVKSLINQDQKSGAPNNGNLNVLHNLLDGNAYMQNVKPKLKRR